MPAQARHTVQFTGVPEGHGAGPTAPGSRLGWASGACQAGQQAPCRLSSDDHRNRVSCGGAGSWWLYCYFGKDFKL